MATTERLTVTLPVELIEDIDRYERNRSPFIAEAVGHEQSGVRPCIAVSDPEVNADQRFPLIAVVPVTGTPGEGALYPELSPGKSGLMKTSYALIDHLRSIDRRRIHRMFGRVTKASWPSSIPRLKEKSASGISAVGRPTSARAPDFD
jgi:mRNA-degrading endonuclease toxin of MazEF toxin-antitoxin module